MKKITLLKSLLVVMALSLFSFSAMAEEVLAYTINFENTRTSDDSNALTTSNFVSKAIKGGAEYVSSCSATDKCYEGNGALKLGTSKVTGYFTLNLSEKGKVNASKVVVYTKKYSSDTGKINCSINGGTAVSITPGNAGECSINNLISTIKISTTAKRAYVVKIEVYTNLESGDVTPGIFASMISFGTLTETNQSKILTVTGANLTNAITATLKTGTAFELSGELTKDGGDLTVKFIATAAGTYSDEITLTSGETTTTVAVSATYVVLEGEGTKENPYTCADVKLLNNSLTATKYWVKGYILGSLEDNKIAETNVNSNLALGATAGAKDFVPVQLPNNNVRIALNLVDNPTLLGREVLVYGTLENYFSKPGVKNVTDYVILEAQGGDDEQVEATAIALNKTTASLEQYREEKLIATLTPAEATTQIVWTSSNEEIATVTDGLVKAVGVGEATITATAGTLSATCVVTVSEATVLTCAQAAEYASSVSANNVNYEGGQYVVSGYVTSIATEYSEQYKNISVWVADTKDGGEVLQLYRAKPENNVIPAVGDSIVAVGYLTKYTKDNTTTPEMAAGCVCRVVPAPVAPVAPANPVIAIEEGVVTFSCETEGAKIMYAFVENGEELTDAMYQQYTGEISINNGSYTVYAYAVNGTLKSEVVSMRIKVDNGVAVGAEVVAIAEIFVQNRTIVTEGEFQIYTVTGQNVTDMNGALANGVYVVRSANAIAKVVVR